MIYTVTFNPALDYVVKMDSLELGMVNRSKSEAIFYVKVSMSPPYLRT